MPTPFDLIIIGSGPGGYETAAAAAQRGQNVLIVERDQPGGTCLNRGCIPTKCLCKSAQVIHTVAQASEFGVDVNGYTPNYTAAAERKDQIVDQLREGVVHELSDTTIVYGQAQFVAPRVIEVAGEEYSAPHIIVATGSAPASLNLPGSEGRVVNSDQLLQLTQLPESIAIIGGGVIGMEFACIFHQFGVKVTVLEFCDEILPGFDREIAKRLRMALKRQGINIVTKASATSIDSDGTLHYREKEREKTLQAQIIAEAVGRRPVLPPGLEEQGVELTKRGFIAVDSQMHTSIPGVSAVGDVNGVCLLAHAATAQGRVAIGLQDMPKAMPAAVFTTPECAMVGLTQEQCIASEKPYVTGTATYRSNGKALASGEPDGLVKAIVSPSNKQILGFHACGAHAADLVQEVSIAIESQLTASDVAHSVHIHPTLGELVSRAMSNALSKL